MSQLFHLPKALAFSTSGALRASERLYFYLTNTTTATPVYTTSALTTPITQPVSANANGEWQVIWLDSSITYKCSRYDYSSGSEVLVDTIDPVNSILLSQAELGAILYPRTAAEIAASVTPVNYAYKPGHIKRWAVGGGVVDDTQAILNWIASVGASGFVLYGDGDTYRINADNLSGLLFTGKTNFKVFARGMTIKVLDGAGVVGGYGMMYFTNCQDGDIYDLTLDANRAGRTIPGEAGAYSLYIADICKRLRFHDSHFPNAVIDGVTFTTSTPATAASYPTDCRLIRCTAKNAYRNGGSAIAYKNLYLDDCEFSGANGLAAAEIGFDAEPDNGYIYCSGLYVNGGLYKDNPGGNLVITGYAGTTNTKVRLNMPRLENGGDVNLKIARAVDVKGSVDSGDCTGSGSYGVIEIGDSSGAVEDIDLEVYAKGVTTTTALAVLNIRAEATGLVKAKFVGADLACRGVNNAAKAEIDATVNNCTSTNPAIQNSGAKSVFRINTDTTTAAAFYNTGADVEVSGQITDFGASASAGIQHESGATGSITKNVSFHQRTSIPGGEYGIRYNNVAPRVLENINGKSAGTDFTTANIVGFLSGVAGSLIRNISPSVQTRTGAGAIDIAAGTTHIVTTAADALTLADGGEGQMKLLIMKTDGGDGTLTPTNLAKGTTITFNDVDDDALLYFTEGQWRMLGGTATLA
jgi:hypothetical protein